MALYRKAEFARFCKVSNAHISVAITRGKVIEEKDGKIDSENPINLLYKATCDENAVRAGEPEKVAEIAEKQAPAPKKSQKAPKPPKEPTSNKRNDLLDKKFDIEIEEKEARINKIRQEARMAELKEQKLTGQLIPTDVVYSTIRQLSQSLMMSFKNMAEAAVTDIAKSAKMNRDQMAALRKQMKDHINTAINQAVDDAQKNVDNITKEYSQAKKAA
jgi:hypothetical protein